jgi:hypothetical protein
VSSRPPGGESWDRIGGTRVRFASHHVRKIADVLRVNVLRPELPF